LALFPGRRGPDAIERVALGFGLSLAMIPLLALALDLSPWGLTARSIVAGLVLEVLGVAGVAAARVLVLPAPARRAPPRSVPLPRLVALARAPGARVPLALGVAAVVVMGTALGWAVASRDRGAPVTELALVNEAGQPTDFPREVVPGEWTEVRLEVTNREGEPTTFEVRVGEAGIGETVPIFVLADGETWAGPVRFTVVEAGPALPVAFELRRQGRDDGAPPYRVVRLIVEGQAIPPGPAQDGP
jgi:uncharacterized membrane protein